MGSADQRRGYYVIPSLIERTQTQNHPLCVLMNVSKYDPRNAHTFHALLSFPVMQLLWNLPMSVSVRVWWWVPLPVKQPCIIWFDHIIITTLTDNSTKKATNNQTNKKTTIHGRVHYLWNVLHGILYVKHDDVMRWTRFPCYWPFVRGICRWQTFPSQRASQ